MHGMFQAFGGSMAVDGTKAGAHYYSQFTPL